VRFLKLFLRGLKDAYDQFVMLMVASILWWICALLIVPGPPATVALFRIMDPRNQVALPDVKDFFGVLKQSFSTAWGIAGFTVPVILILLWNSLFFQGVDSAFALMIPLWFVMIAITFILMLYAFATVAAMESRVRNAFRGATFLLVMHPFRSGAMIVLLFLVSVVFAVLVLPIFLFGPGVVAAVVNRFVLDGYDIEIIDPNSPTQERSREVASGVNLDEGLRGWVRRSRGGASGGKGRT
jgi:uncharacterized membrane protein YesL